MSIKKTQTPNSRSERWIGAGDLRARPPCRHEHVVDIHAVEEQPIPYLVMEYVAGETLQQKLDRVGPLEVADVLRIGQQIARNPGASRERRRPPHPHGAAVGSSLPRSCSFWSAQVTLTEATGVTKLHSTVIRIFTPDGTLIVEADDPGVKVTIEGDGGLVITGAGLEEIRLRPGSYKVYANRDGKPVLLDRELVNISRGGREIVKVKLEAPAEHAG